MITEKRKLDGTLIGYVINNVIYPKEILKEKEENLKESGLLEIVNQIKKAIKQGAIKDDPTLIDRWKNLKLKEIEENYQSKISEPFKYNGNIFETDDKSLNILNKVLVALPDGQTIVWRTADNKMINLSKQDLQKIAQGILQRNQAYFIKRCELKDKLKSLTDLESIKNFDTSII